MVVERLNFLDKIAKNIFQYTFEIKIMEDLFINNYKSSAIRGFIGFMLKRILCPLKKNECKLCEINDECKYFNFFESTKIIKKENQTLSFRDLVRPYIIYSDDDRKVIKKGEILKFNITLFSREVNKMLPYLILSFKEGGSLYGIGGNRSKFELVSVYNFKKENIMLNNNLKEPVRIFAPNNYNANRIRINLLSPLILKNNTILTLEFILRNIIKRAYLISKYYIDKSLTYSDYEDVLNRFSKSISEIEIVDKKITFSRIYRYSNRKKKKMFFNGLKGSSCQVINKCY